MRTCAAPTLEPTVGYKNWQVALVVECEDILKELKEDFVQILLEEHPSGFIA
jgi:hypothetical protein